MFVELVSIMLYYNLQLTYVSLMHGELAANRSTLTSEFLAPNISALLIVGIGLKLMNEKRGQGKILDLSKTVPTLSL